MRFLIIVILSILPTFLLSNTQKLQVNIFYEISNNDTSFKEIKTKTFSKKYMSHINYGFENKKTIWLKIDLKNLYEKENEFILEINNPLIEDIVLYDRKGNFLLTGMLHVEHRIKSLNPSFRISLSSNQKKTYYLKISNKTTALQFSVFFKDIDSFFQEDLLKQFFIIFFIGVIFAFVLYSFILFLYTKEKSYLYYCLYIFILIFQQLTYIGFLPLYMPKIFTYYDNLLVVPKVGFVIITAIVFARSFLKTYEFYKIDLIYKSLILFVLLQIIFLSSPSFYYPEVTVLTGLFFIFFNLYSAIYIYKRGNKQARFFIAGWSFLCIGYFLTIIDALGAFSVMYFLPPLVLILTLIEALFFLVAFTDRVKILQEEKEILDKELFIQLEQRNTAIKEEVLKQTKSLKNLYRELHHRVKNNLQIILSIIELQSYKVDDKLKEEFKKLENRIKSISKTHELLYLNENIEKINMYEYLYILSEDVIVSFNKDIDIFIKTNLKIPLKIAVYLGIIVNELLSNSMKHTNCNSITISLKRKNKEYILRYLDNGQGYKDGQVFEHSLGLKLVNNLVKLQLMGEINTNCNNKCEYIIRFKI